MIDTKVGPAVLLTPTGPVARLSWSRTMSQHSRGGAPADRARGVAAEYRKALTEADPDAAARLDAAAIALGEGWVVARFEPLAIGARWMSRKEVAALAHVDVDTVSTWTARGIRRGGRSVRLRRYRQGYSSAEVRDFLHARRSAASSASAEYLADPIPGFEAAPAPPPPLRRRLISRTGEPTSQTSCVTECPDGSVCGSQVAPGSPAPLCLEHGIEMWRFYTAALDDPAQFADATAAVRADEDVEDAARVCVYYLRVGDYIKIGSAEDLADRMRQYPPDAELLATEPGGRARETQRLAEFEVFRAARREWFRPAPRLLEHIARLTEARSA